MYGTLRNFPEAIHSFTSFATSASSKRLQQALIRAIRDLNKTTLNLETVTRQSLSECSVSFELGIAEADGFNYVDDEETSRVLKAVQRECFSTMDFFCCLCYRKRQGNKEIRLRSDYYFLRFMFGEREASLQTSHEKGSRYISPEDITLFLARTINEVSQKRILRMVDVS